jgi:3-deoxy-manno-octulosonate cytidylyltransferase (CMP-KDO synthetase)
MPDLIVIPARYGSQRLPGKPLLPIAGRTLLERVIDIARRAASDLGDVDLLVATDDARIAAHAEALGCAVAMTANDISSGTGRALAAAQQRTVRPGVVLNLQGDAPFVPAPAIVALMRAARETDAAVATAVVPLGWDALDALRSHKLASPFSGTTCIRGDDGRALWFSKAIVPAIRDEARLRTAVPLSPVLRHLGLYAYRMAALEAFEAAPPSRYEQLEGLEQLRFLELGLSIAAIDVDQGRFSMSGIDTADDVRLAERLIAELGDPFGGA